MNNQQPTRKYLGTRKTAVFSMVIGISFYSITTKANEVESLYNRGCAACHNTGAANAPKLGDAAAWQVRLSNSNLEGLYKNAIKGKGAMPPKGLCSNCTDEEIRAIVDYMINKK